MAPFPLVAWNFLLSWHLTLCWSPQLWTPVIQLVSSKDTLYYVPLSMSLLSSCQIREIMGLISKPTGGGCNYKSKFVTICAAAWTEPGVHTQKQLSSIPPTPICLCCCLSFGQLFDYCVGMDCEQWIHSSLENLQQPIWLSTPISHTAHQPFVLRIESEAAGGRQGDSSCEQNNGRLPQSCEDTPECLMLKLITSSSWLAPPWTLHHRREPWNCTWHSHSGVWGVEAQPHSAPLKQRMSQYFSNETRWNKKGLLGWGTCCEYTTGCHWRWWNFLPTLRWRW